MLGSAVATEQKQRILITQALPGMVLAEPVMLPGRILLCGRDAELSEPLIHKMMQRGIKRIIVKGHPIPTPPPESWTVIQERLARRFSRVAHNPFMVALGQSAGRIMARRMK